MQTITRSLFASVRLMAISLGFIRQDLNLSDGASRTAIDHLKRKGSFVAREESDLGTCVICLEEFSSSPEAKLIRMDCSHEYHQACLLSWLEKKKRCPICRSSINEDIWCCNFIYFWIINSCSDIN